MVTLDTKIKDIVADPDKKAIIEEYIPNFTSYREYSFIKGFKAKFLLAKGKIVGLSPEQEKDMMERLLD